MEQAHQKHAGIQRAAYGTFHRQEWALIGAPCGSIKKLTSDLAALLRERWKIAYVDADHQEAGAPARETLLTRGFSLEYTDKIAYHRLDFQASLDAYQYRTLFNDQDLVLVNGNHYTAKRQIVLIDPRKEASLQKKLDRLTQVDLLLLTEDHLIPYPFLLDHLSELGQKDVPILSINDTASIAGFLNQHLENSLPPLLGLVLAGGKSVRMGDDKSRIDYHGLPQRDHAARLLQPYCREVYLSVRPDQTGEPNHSFPLITDTFLGLGPLGAILSAFREKPDAAWLVIACDLPFLNPDTLELLLRERNPSLMATAFNSPVNNLPEPLIAIWEPRSYPILLQFLAQGYDCPRKALINSPIHLLEAPDPQALENVNTPEEKKSALEKLKNKE